MKVLYTCITNCYDTLRAAPIQPGWDFICFCDEKTALTFFGNDKRSSVYKGWIIYVLPDSHYDKLSRKVKILPHVFLPFEYDVSIWVDANIQMKCDLDKLIWRKHYCVMTHPNRNNIFDEAKACIEMIKDEPAIISKQVEKYINEGYDGQGMVATGIIIRTDHPYNMAFNEGWWTQVRDYSRRDQLSFNYWAWKTKFEFQTFPFLEGTIINPHDNKSL